MKPRREAGRLLEREDDLRRATQLLGHRVYARGSARLSARGKRTRLHLTRVRPMRRGAYVLTVSIGNGKRARILLRKTIRMRW